MFSFSTDLKTFRMIKIWEHFTYNGLLLLDFLLYYRFYRLVYYTTANVIHFGGT